MGWLSSLVSAGASLIGAKSEEKGQDRANQVNIDEAQKNRDFQERMSSTAHVREVKDLIAAGLNPILSSKYGGSSTPSGSSARVESTKKGRGALALEGASAASKIPVMKAQKGLLGAQTALATAHASSAGSQARVDKQMADIQTDAYGRLAMKANVYGKPIGNIAKGIGTAVGIGVAGRAIKNIGKKKFRAGKAAKSKKELWVELNNKMPH